MKKVFAILLSLVLALSLSVSAFASEAGPTDSADYSTVVKPIFDNILKQLSVSNIVSLLAAVMLGDLGEVGFCHFDIVAKHAIIANFQGINTGGLALGSLHLSKK